MGTPVSCEICFNSLREEIVKRVKNFSGEESNAWSTSADSSGVKNWIEDCWESAIRVFKVYYIICKLSAISYQLSAISYQLSAISYQLSAISYQLSAISYQLSAISYQLMEYVTG
ncbi:hypothetical protein [Moorena sp. SIO3A2]|uniref:hypothetical protein n=1 Tax=Moorena sp. SIO3A2 TaxID=2607841 RepID=UPI002579ED51|nr:hypothetical protein [Moorena sp. SIO3A2]